MLINPSDLGHGTLNLMLKESQTSLDNHVLED